MSNLEKIIEYFRNYTNDFSSIGIAFLAADLIFLLALIKLVIFEIEIPSGTISIPLAVTKQSQVAKESSSKGRLK